MNEEELKNIWQTDRSAPQIDFAALQNSLNDWQDKLRRKIRIDIAVQIVSVAIAAVVVWLYPKLFFVFPLAIALAVWYIRKILAFYRLENESAGGEAKLFVGEKLRMMKSFINQTRLIIDVLTLLIVPAAFYAFGYFDSAAIMRERIVSMIVTLAAAEIAAIVLTEIYFKIFYASAVAELKDLQRQLNFDE